MSDRCFSENPAVFFMMKHSFIAPGCTTDGARKTTLRNSKHHHVFCGDPCSTMLLVIHLSVREGVSPFDA